MPRTALSHVLAATLAATTVAGFATAATAQADSIAYLKGGDIWLSEPDGSRHFQVTATGGYSTVSQSDRGRLVALKGTRIHTLERDGTLVHDIGTPVAAGQGPFDPAISPDGLKIAYSYTAAQQRATGFTRPGELTPFAATGYRPLTGWGDPSFTRDNEVLVSDRSSAADRDAAIYSPGEEDPVSGWPGGLSSWFSDPGAGGLRDGEQTRDATKLAFVAGAGDALIRIYRAKGGYPYVPDACFQLTTTPGHAFRSPSWSPDGAHLSWSEPDGIHTMAIPDMTSGCGTPTEDSRLVIPGGAAPDWGPADVPAPRPVPATGGGGTPGTGGGGAPGTGGAPGGGVVPGGTATPAPVTPGGTGATPGPVRGVEGGGTATGTVRMTLRTPRLRVALARGLAVRLTAGRPGASVTVRVTHGARVVATRKVRLGSAGTATATVRFTKAARRSLARRARVALVVRAPGVTRKVTLRR